MTLQEFQDLVHTEYQGDTTTPTSTETDWGTRLLLLKAAILDWDAEKGILWSELWALNNTEQSSSQTTDGTTLAFNCTANFVRDGGFIRLIDGNSNSSFYKVKKVEEVELYRNTTEKIAFFTGNESSGFVLNFLTAPATGLTVEYPFYKKPTIPSAAGDDIEMSKPMFTIHHTLSKLHELDGEGDRAGLALSRAGAVLASMRTFNVMPSWWQDNAPVDVGALATGGFGR